MKKTLFILFFCIATFASTGFTQTNTDSSITKVEPDKFPEFKKGLNGWIQFLEKNLDRDLLYRKKAPSGKYLVVASFIVEADGSVKDIKIESDKGYGTSDEVIRILQLSSKQWIPASVKGQAVPHRHKQSITFVN